MSTRLAGVTAVVTGAAGGLGSAVATRLATEGAAVAALDLTENSGISHGDHGPGSMSAWTCDVTDRDAVSRTVEEVVSRYGGVDVLVNNAGLLSGRAGLLAATSI